ncbi:MAG: aminopeptidase P family protein [Thermomicrobiales bacterium]|nr:aminopeptidase P family protein [Thermomicrobiales bacterium]MCO5220858.1 Xaa-Pro peptidase family protein [Thermomicrobiales bacterium]
MMAKGKKTATAKVAAARATPVLQWKIGAAEYAARGTRVREVMAERKLDGLVVFHPIRIAYLSGFFHVTTERPMAIVVAADGSLGALVPLLERENIQQYPVTNVAVYPEYPTGGVKAPMEFLGDLLTEMKLNRKGVRIGYDNNGYLDVNGYEGAGLSEIVRKGVETVRARDIVDRLRAIKSPTELQFTVESCVWGNYAHQVMHDLIEVGKAPLDISYEASGIASRVMLKALGPGYQPLTAVWGYPAGAGFSAGRSTSMPHGLYNAVGLRPGDVLVTGAGSDIGGYNSELERTMIIGEPDAEFIKYFDIMLELQQAGFDALRPGRSFADAERDVSQRFVDLGIEDLQRHHTGHGLGLEGHEWPFIDKGSDEVVIEENMVLSVEPGIYVPGLAGFRHSDTVVIRSHGAERLTFYPRELEALIVPV